MKLIHTAAIMLLLSLLVKGGAQSVTTDKQQSIRLWAGSAPGALGTADHDIPTLTPFLTTGDHRTSTAILICPGGGYHALMTSFEGDHYARFFNELGMNAFVLRYRLGSNGYRHPVMLQDISRALRTIRARATEWDLNPNAIGVIGSSAGGHLASTLMTHFDSGDKASTDTIERQSSRPDFGILCYPVISFGEYAHKGSMHNLLGNNPSQDVMTSLSNELQVTKDTPPTFLLHTAEDAVVRVENSLLFASALARNSVPFALHVYPKGIHGVALGSHEWNPQARHPWTTECTLWLRSQNLIK